MCNATPMKTFKTITVMEINLTTEVPLIEILNPPMYTNRTKQVGRPLGKSHPRNIQPDVFQPEIVYCSYMSQEFVPGPPFYECFDKSTFNNLRLN